ncbi:MAG: hypothetical protein R6U20_08270 [Longimonas sp.]|uniref:hypothetical protein n=1 Tax=Longimonas sp. TaxID=2039626 RepID=UPI0039769995
MNRRNPNRPPYDWMDARVEAYVDGSLPDDEAARFEAALDAAPHWKMQVRHAERIRTTLRERTLPACPPECTEAILDQTVRATAPAPTTAQQTDAASRTASRSSWLDRIAAAFDVLTQPAYSTILAALLVGALVWLIADPILDAPHDTSEPTASHIEAPYTDEDVAQAQAEAEWALAYISDASQDASTTAEREMERALSPFFSAPDASSPATP